MINFKDITNKQLNNSSSERIKIKYQGKCFVLLLDNNLFEVGKTLKELFENIIFNNKYSKVLETKLNTNF